MEGGGVSAETVRQMLGLSDRGAMRELMGLMLAADAPAPPAAPRRQFDYAADPQPLLRRLLEPAPGAPLVNPGPPPNPAPPPGDTRASRHRAAKPPHPEDR